MRYLLLCVLTTLVGFAVPFSSHAALQNIKVLTDQSIDTTSLESIVQGVITRSGAKNNDEKAIAIYEYLHNTIFHWAYPTETAPQSVGPLKVINAYGWGLCGGQHTVLKALYETAGWKCRYVGWPGHTTIEVNYDGQWHYFDVFLKCYFWSKNKTHVVSQEEIAADPSIVLDAVKEGRAARQHLCCGDTQEDVIKGTQHRNVVGDSKGWASVTWRDQNYSPLLNLPSGASLRLDWKAEPANFAISGKAPQHSCGTKDFRSDKILGPLLEHYGPRNWSNGRLVYAPDFSKAADVADVELTGARVHGGQITATEGQGRAIFKLALPYPYVKAQLEAAIEGEGKLALSTDAGKTWKPCSDGDISSLVKQKYDVWLKAEFSGALKSLRLEAVVEHNRGALPYLVQGRNQIKISADGEALPKDNVLSVSYTYQEATVANPQKRTRWEAAGVSYSEPKTVTKEFTSLPASFAIDVAGNTPPKMLTLERALRPH